MSDDDDPLMGVIYLLHFTQPVHHAKHYLGFCQSYESLESRLDYHERGQGSKLIKALRDNGGDFQLVRLWEGTRTQERKLKNRSVSCHVCPICNPIPMNIRLKEVKL